ncbi:MAG: restriction endonuclease [Bacteroidia bacterium]|nr:restriction endonuclease [Bacteroidia bacterium]
MAIYSQPKIARLIDESDNALTNAVKGAKLEELVRYLFCKIPNITFYGSNILDGYRAHELDVVFNNDTRYSELYFLDHAIIAECKNTSHKTSSAQVGWFVRKLQDRIATSGILITLSGITGEADGESNAHSEIIIALIRDGIRILVIRRADILGFQTTDDLVSLLKRKIMKLTIERTIE